MKILTKKWHMIAIRSTCSLIDNEFSSFNTSTLSRNNSYNNLNIYNYILFKLFVLY